MNLENLSPRTKKILLIVLLIVVIAGITLLFIFFGNRGGNPYGDSVTIKNYRENVKNLSDDYENLFMAELYKVIELNLPDGQSMPEVKDATLREGSATQEFLRDLNVYNGSFTIDIESIKQSYSMTYTYSRDPNNVDLGGYPVLANCLPIDQLKYGDFDCVDVIRIETGEMDPIIEYLPYSNLDFSIRSVIAEENKVSLVVTLFLTQADRRGDEAAAIASYKSKVEGWITAIGLNPADYQITYNY